ncbi:hypothetical protein ACFU99_34385 [Streptomyces sp. NPDC057654]|uniref:terpene synthase family protein n=1 Tax=Streptomyces sp. NPDC057654 TaxID=3346196 RepID=UPI00367ED9AC
MTNRIEELQQLRIRPEPFHPIYQLPSRAAVEAGSLNDMVVNWAQDYGLVNGPAARERLAAVRAGDLIARAYPDLRADSAVPLAGWFSWLFAIDDYFDRRGPRTPAGHAAAIRKVLAALPPEPEPEPEPGPGEWEGRINSPLVRLLAHVWRSIAPGRSLCWRMRFITHVTHFVSAFQYEALNRRQRHTPSLDAYVQLRRASGSITACLDLLEFSTGLEVPPLLHETEQLRTMANKAADVVVWVNDVVSLKKELAIGETTNGVLVVRRELGLSAQESVDYIYARVADDIRSFRAAEAELERICAGWLGVTEAERAALNSLTHGMKCWMRGNLDWSVRSERYAVPQEGTACAATR